MKKTMLLLFFMTYSISFSIVIGQNMKYPSWINGTWHSSHNSFESDTRKFVFWTFANDSIYIEHGLHLNKSERKCLDQDYVGYRIAEYSNDSLYRVSFLKGFETAVYEFKFMSNYFKNKPAFTYSLTINGIKKKEHSFGALFIKD